MYFPPMPVGLEPWPDLGVLVVGGVVLIQNRSLTAVSPSEWPVRDRESRT
jgi:hypothetical protein